MDHTHCEKPGDEMQKVLVYKFGLFLQTWSFWDVHCYCYFWPKAIDPETKKNPLEATVAKQSMVLNATKGTMLKNCVHLYNSLPKPFHRSLPCRATTPIRWWHNATDQTLGTSVFIFSLEGLSTKKSTPTCQVWSK